MELFLLIVSAVGVTLSVLLLGSLLRAVRINTSVRRVRFVASVLRDLENRPECLALYRELEAGSFSWTPDSYQAQAVEPALSALLRIFRLPAAAHAAGLLTLRECAPLEEAILLIMGNSGVQAYIAALKPVAGSTNPPYSDLQRLYRKMDKEGRAE